MYSPGSRDQSLLINKLVLLVLVGILGCLVILVVRQKNFMDEREQAVESQDLLARPATSVEPAATIPSPTKYERLARSASFHPTAPSSSYPEPPSNGDATLVEESAEKIPAAPPAAAQPVVAFSGPIPSGDGIAGTVWLRGTPPPEVPIQMDSAC